MPGQALIYRPGAAAPEIMALDSASILSVLQDAVGGWIERVPGFETIVRDGRVVPCVAFCNEEGKLERMPLNSTASILWDHALRRVVGEDGERLYPTGLWDREGRLRDTLVGAIVVVIGDAAFMAEL